MGNPNLYTPQRFNKEDQFLKMYGADASRKDKRKFEQYWNSDKRYEDEIAHNKAEHEKMFNSIDQARIDAGKRLDVEANRIHTQLANRKIETPLAPKPVKPSTDWNAVAQQNGFADVEAVRKWQSENGLVADGKFGAQSRAKWNALQQTPRLAVRPIINAFDENPISPIPRSISSASVSPKSPTNTITVEQFKSHENFRPHRAGQTSIEIDGVSYPIMVTTGLSDGQYGLLNDESYAFDEKTGKVRRLTENGLGQAYNIWAEGDDWVDFFNNPEQVWLRANPKPTRETHPGNSYTGAYTNWFNSYQNAKNTGFKKQGGTMNRINYFQQGGAAPQQDIKTQVTALVQAAMQGDQKATQQVNQIMEAAKAGDQQAIQIAQIMEQVIKELQGQATAAKWGAKLGYIRSLKYAKGGKTCPACKNGGIPENANKAYIKSTKKVEEKACGGKAKKKYFGGLI